MLKKNLYIETFFFLKREKTLHAYNFHVPKSITEQLLRVYKKKKKKEIHSFQKFYRRCTMKDDEG